MLKEARGIRSSVELQAVVMNEYLELNLEPSAREVYDLN